MKNRYTFNLTEQSSSEAPEQVLSLKSPTKSSFSFFILYLWFMLCFKFMTKGAGITRNIFSSKPCIFIFKIMFKSVALLKVRVHSLVTSVFKIFLGKLTYDTYSLLACIPSQVVIFICYTRCKQYVVYIHT